MDKERRIEKLLRAFAKKRKADAGAPLEMHPATRRLLQGEVARRTKAKLPTEQSWWRFWFGTPRRAFAVCAVMSLIISGTVFLTTMKPSKPAMNLAKMTDRIGRPQDVGVVKQPAPPAAASPAPEMPAPASPPAPVSVALADRKDADTGLAHGGGGGAGGISGMEPATTPPASASAPLAMYDDTAAKDTTTTYALNGPAPEGATLQKGDSIGGSYKDTVLLTNSFQATVAGEGALTAAPALDAEKQLAETKVPQSTTATLNFASAGSRFENRDALKADKELPLQQFYRLRAATDKADVAKEKSRALGAVKKSSAGDVLDSFSVAQEGNQITMVDSDGSQYTGFVQPMALSGAMANSPAPASTTPAPSRRAGGLTSAGAFNMVTFDSSGTQNYTFRVTGTNVSLKQLVVFSGKFVALTNGVVTRGESVTNSIASDQFGPAAALQNLRIEGRAVVGGKKTAVEIEAAPVEP